MERKYHRYFQKDLTGYHVIRLDSAVNPTTDKITFNLFPINRTSIWDSNAQKYIPIRDRFYQFRTSYTEFYYATSRGCGGFQMSNDQSCLEAIPKATSLPFESEETKTAQIKMFLNNSLIDTKDVSFKYSKNDSSDTTYSTFSITHSLEGEENLKLGYISYTPCHTHFLVKKINNIPTGLNIFEWGFYNSSDPCINTFTDDTPDKKFLWNSFWPDTIKDAVYEPIIHKRQAVFVIKYKPWELSDINNFIVTNNNVVADNLFNTKALVQHQINFNTFVEPRPKYAEVTYFFSPNADQSSPTVVFGSNGLPAVNGTFRPITDTNYIFTSPNMLIGHPYGKTGVATIALSIKVSYDDNLTQGQPKLWEKKGDTFFSKTSTFNPYVEGAREIGLRGNDIKLDHLYFNLLNRKSTTNCLQDYIELTYQSFSNFSVVNNFAQCVDQSQFEINSNINVTRNIKLKIGISPGCIMYNELPGPHPRQITNDYSENYYNFIWSKNGTILKNETVLMESSFSLAHGLDPLGTYNVKVYKNSILIGEKTLTLISNKAILTISIPPVESSFLNKTMRLHKNTKVTIPTRYIKATDFKKLSLVSENPNIIEVISPVWNSTISYGEAAGFFESLLIKNAGTCKITIHHAGSSDYTSNSVDLIFTIIKTDQFIAFDYAANQKLDAEELPVYIPISGYCYFNTFGGTSIQKNGLAPIYSSSNTSIAEIEGENIKIKSFGSCLITASHPGNDTFNPTTQNNGLLNVTQINKPRPTLSWRDNLLDNYVVKPWWPQPILRPAFSESNSTIEYTSSNPAIIYQEFNSNTLTIKPEVTGIVTIIASQTGNSSYKAPLQIQRVFTISGMYPQISWDISGEYYDAESIPKPYIYNKSFLKEKTKYRYVKYNSNDIRIINPINSDFDFEIMNTGAVNISAHGPYNTYGDLTANVYYQESVQKTITIIPQSQSILFNPNDVISSGNTNFEWRPNLIFNPFISLNTARKNSDYPAPKVQYVSSNIDIISPCDENGNLNFVGSNLKIIKPGVVIISGIQNGGISVSPTKSFFNPAQNFIKTYTILKKRQDITYKNLPKLYTSNISESFPLSEYFKASSTLPISYTSSNPSILEINGEDLIVRSAGTVNIIADQLGDDYYFPTSSTRTLTVEKIINPINVEDLPILSYEIDYLSPTLINNNADSNSLTEIISSDVNVAQGVVGLSNNPSIYIINPGKVNLTFIFGETPLYNQKIITKQLIIKGPPYARNSIVNSKINQRISHILDINNDQGDPNENVIVNQISMPNYFGLSNKTITGFSSLNGTYTGVIELSNFYGTSGQNIIFQVAPIITGAKNISTKVDNLFSFPIGTSGVVNYYTGINLPPGLSVINNYITGTPIQRGIFSSDITIGYNDGINFNKTTEIFNFEIRKNLPIVIVPESNITGYVGYPFDYKIKYNADPNRSPDSFSTTNLPNGLFLNGVDGLIYGRPKSLGTFSIGLKAYNDGGESNLAPINFIFLPNTLDVPCLA